MKIAVLIRGQLKNCKVSAKLFQKGIVERYPHHEFKVFMHTWTTEPRFITEKLTNGVMREGLLQTIPSDILNERINYFNPTRYIVETPVDFSKVLMNICKKTHSDFKFIEWINEYKKDFPDAVTRGAKAIKFMYDPPTDKKLFEEALIRANYYLAQTYSACKANEILQDYCDETGYEPDLIFIHRADVALNTSGEKWDNLFGDLHEILTYTVNGEENPKFNLLRNPYQSDPIIVRRMSGQGDHIWFCDWNFWCLPKQSNRFLGRTAVDHFKTIFLKHKPEVIPYLRSHRDFQHSWWTTIGIHATFMDMSNFLPPKTIVRNMIQEDSTDIDKLQFEELVEYARELTKIYKETSPPTKEYFNLSHEDAVELIIGDALQ